MTHFRSGYWRPRWWPDDYFTDGDATPTTSVTGDGTTASWTLTASTASGAAEVATVPGSWTLTATAATGANTAREGDGTAEAWTLTGASATGEKTVIAREGDGVAEAWTLTAPAATGEAVLVFVAYEPEMPDGGILAPAARLAVAARAGSLTAAARAGSLTAVAARAGSLTAASQPGRRQSPSRTSCRGSTGIGPNPDPQPSVEGWYGAHSEPSCSLSHNVGPESQSKR